MTYMYITKFVLINELEKDHSTTETCPLKSAVIFIQVIITYNLLFGAAAVPAFETIILLLTSM